MPACNLKNFVNREKELAYVKDKVIRLASGQPFAPHERVFHFVGPSGIGKSCLLEKCYGAFANDPKCIPILIKLETLGSGSEAFVNQFLAAVYEKFCNYQGIAVDKAFVSLSRPRKLYSSILVRSINLGAMSKVVVILLDEINVPQRKELQDIEENLLEELFHGNERVVLITAGRSYPMFNDVALRPSSANTFLLRAFDEKTTGEQLEKLKPGSALIANKVLELGGGVPRNNTKLARHVVGSPPHMPNELHAVQSLLADVKGEIEERFHAMIEAICILQAFFPEEAFPLIKSHPTLGEQWDESRIKEIFPELKQVQIGPGALISWDREKRSWVFDEPTRALFERELRMREPQLWRKLQCAAYQMYKQWGEELNSQLYRGRAEYHRECLKSAGMDCDDLKKEG